MDAKSQFNNVAALLRKALEAAEEGAVPSDMITHILRVTEAQAEMASLGLFEKEVNA